MTLHPIKFGVWSPSKEIFVKSWIEAGIWTAEGEYTDEYQGVFCNSESWPGIIDGVDGWHTNVLVYGEDLIKQMTYGIDQYDKEGNLKSVFDRTWATAIFRLEEQPAKEETKFPAGFRNADGITYADASHFSSPSNVIG